MPTATLISWQFPATRNIGCPFKKFNDRSDPRYSHRMRRVVKCNSDSSPPIEQSGKHFPAVMDISEIKNRLPHRYPFLLVDKLIEFESMKYAVGVKNVTFNEPFFTGHFPEREIMPGVLMVEAMAQVGGLIVLDPSSGGDKENFFFAGIDNVKFRRPIVPGDTLIMKVTLDKLNKRFGVAKMSGSAYVGDELVVEALMTFAIFSEK